MNQKGCFWGLWFVLCFGFGSALRSGPQARATRSAPNLKSPSCPLCFLYICLISLLFWSFCSVFSATFGPVSHSPGSVGPGGPLRCFGLGNRTGIGGGWAQGWGSPISLRKHKSPAAREQQQENTPSTSSPPLGYLGLWKCLAGQSQSQLPGSPGAVRYIQCLSAVYMAQPGGAARNSSNGSANTPFFRVEMYLCCFFFVCLCFFFFFFFLWFFFCVFFFSPLSLSLVT